LKKEKEEKSLCK